ncbi:UNVERIFIED_CONTAM: hypothetical protein Scaly_0110200 [Sesamum calycinum]|uniref:DSBA-like thioredoxin domain-containing protein n=1 Tax=Sesamum calycinum TaxID=2727403 RepID=A0AAW2SXQ6_9LAMI
MASVSSSNGKKLIQIDISSDTVCPWCFVGKKNLDKAIASSNDNMHLRPDGIPLCCYLPLPRKALPRSKCSLKSLGLELYKSRLEWQRFFKGLGLDYDTDGLTGNTLDSHRLIYFAGKQGLDKQHNLVEELGTGYFTRGKYIGDREFLVEAANKVGVEGAAEFLEDPNNGLKEVTEEINKYSSHVSGVPHYVINGKYELSGGQPPEVFLRAFQAAASK